MDQPIIIGVDLAKSVFQVHGVSVDGHSRAASGSCAAVKCWPSSRVSIRA